MSEQEKYLTQKELSYELYKMGLPYGRAYLLRLQHRGCPFAGTRARLSEVVAWMKEERQKRLQARRAELQRRREKKEKKKK